MKEKEKEIYTRPVVVKHKELKDITAGRTMKPPA
jgi:hypothetical protein